MNRAGRVATVAAVGFLLCDAILLIYGAVEFRRVSLGVAGGACALLAVLVFVGWRRHLRLLAELTVARREMRAQVEEMRDLIRRSTS